MTTHSIYNDNFYDEQKNESYESARKVLPYVFEILDTPNKLIDIGCGTGSWLKAAQSLGVKNITGIDGDYVPREQLMISNDDFYPANLNHPKTIKEQFKDINFDIAMSLEVAEHIDEQHSQDFIDLLTSLSDTVLFSAAIPYQGGDGHVNENWPEYWAQKFKEKGYIPVDTIRDKIWNKDGICWWYKQNILLFIHTSKILERLDLLENSNSGSLTKIHPYQYLVSSNRAGTHKKYGTFQDIQYFKSLQNKKAKIKRNYEFSECLKSNTTLNEEINYIAFSQCDLPDFSLAVVDALICTPSKKVQSKLKNHLNSKEYIWGSNHPDIDYFNIFSFDESSIFSPKHRAIKYKRNLLNTLLNNTKLNDDWFKYLANFGVIDRNIDWYNQVFKYAKKEQIKIDLSTNYFYLPLELLKYIGSTKKDLKVILVKPYNSLIEKDFNGPISAKLLDELNKLDKFIEHWKHAFSNNLLIIDENELDRDANYKCKITEFLNKK